MHYPKKKRLSAYVVFCILLALVLSVMAYGPPLHAQTDPVITNLAQLTQALGRENPIVRDIKLDATVFACNTNSGALVVQDESGAELLEMDGLGQVLQPGDKIRVQFSRCFFRHSDVGIYVSAAPTLDNDGVHGLRTCSGEYRLEAGRFPLRVDWFNQYRRRWFGGSLLGNPFRAAWGRNEYRDDGRYDPRFSRGML